MRIKRDKVSFCIFVVKVTTEQIVQSAFFLYQTVVFVSFFAIFPRMKKLLCHLCARGFSFCVILMFTVLEKSKHKNKNVQL